MLASLVLQSTLLASITLGGVKADLPLVLVTIFAMYNGPAFGSKFGFGVGLVLDLLVGHMIGLQAFSKMVIGLVAGLGMEKLFRQNWLLPVTAVFAATVFDQLFYVLGLAIFGAAMGWRAMVPQTILLTAVYNALLAVVLHRLLFSLGDTIAYWDEVFRRSG